VLGVVDTSMRRPASSITDRVMGGLVVRLNREAEVDLPPVLNAVSRWDKG
jgi:hypothetical protein